MSLTIIVLNFLIIAKFLLGLPTKFFLSLIKKMSFVNSKSQCKDCLQTLTVAKSLYRHKRNDSCKLQQKISELFLDCVFCHQTFTRFEMKLKKKVESFLLIKTDRQTDMRRDGFGPLARPALGPMPKKKEKKRRYFHSFSKALRILPEGCQPQVDFCFWASAQKGAMSSDLICGCFICLSLPPPPPFP
jgi:hypothetical protein